MSSTGGCGSCKKHGGQDSSQCTNNNNNEMAKSSDTTTTTTATPTTTTSTVTKKNTVSFYRRPLPAGLIAFSSEEGKQVFSEALALGGMEGYFSLAEQFHTQSDPAYCGLGTLAMVLNALQIDPDRLWKGPWRWFSEDMLDCCVPLEYIKENGITLSQFRCLARCNGAHVDLYHADESSEDDFRQKIIEATSSSGTKHLVISYHRGTLKQTGDGHFSPIGGYHAEKDLALVLDVARFKYPPYWVPVPLLFKSLLPHDSATGRSRGYLMLTRSKIKTSLLFKLIMTGGSGSNNNNSSCTNGVHNHERYQTISASWSSIVGFFERTVPQKLATASEADQNAEGFIKLMLQELFNGGDTAVGAPLLQNCGCRQMLTPSASGVEATAMCSTEFAKQHGETVQQLLKEVRATQLYQLVRKVYNELCGVAPTRSSGCGCPAPSNDANNTNNSSECLQQPNCICEIATLLLLSCPLPPAASSPADINSNNDNGTTIPQHVCEELERLRDWDNIIAASSNNSRGSDSPLQLLRDEVVSIRHQFKSLFEFCCGGSAKKSSCKHCD